MEAPQAVTGFDSAERERIRAALRRYMRENRIGAPALQYRIEEADQPRKREIPLSTLQRFIAGKHHTQDHHVALCHAFVKDLSYYGEGREVEQLGAALLSFVQPEIPEVGVAPDAAPLAKFAGTWESSASVLTLTAAPGQKFLLARESARPLLAAGQNERDPEIAARRRMREGVMIIVAAGAHAMLRDTLTRQIRTAYLARQGNAEEPGVLQGECWQPAFMAGMRSIHERVRYTAAALPKEA